MLIPLLASTAFAMSSYPGAIAEDLGMPCTPTCDLCHSSASGGGAPTTAFGLAMVDRGLTASTSTLAAALDAMIGDAVDSDADGIMDTEALAQGLDPNGGTPYCAEGAAGPSYGCLSVTASPATGGAGLLLGLAALLRRRRR